MDGKANRTLRELVELEMSSARRYGRRLSLLVLEVEDLSAVRSTRGPTVGDAILRRVAEALRLVPRREDIVERTGEGTWAVLLRETSRLGGLALAARLLERIAMTSFAAGLPSVRCSAGVAEMGLAMTSGELIKTAEAALGDAQRAGRGEVRSALKELGLSDSAHPASA